MSIFNDWTTHSRAIVVSLAGAILLLIGGWFFWPRTPTQMGADEEVFTSVDALFTAVTSHDKKLLLQAEQRLKGFQTAGKLPGSAAAYLDGVIEVARGGDWQSAAEDLYWFMKGQRRDGARSVQVAKKK